MSSLPILSSQTPSHGKVESGKTGNNTPSAEDFANGAAPFGELLAKQLSPQGLDMKRDLLKTLTLAEGDTLPVDANAALLQGTAELRTDGMTLPSDLLASLMHRAQSAPADAADVADAATTSTTVLHGDTAAADPLARRASAGIDLNKTDGQADVPEMRPARPGAAPDTAFAVALQAEKKAGLAAATGKLDTALQPAQLTSISAPVIGMANAQTPAAPHAVTQATIATPLHQPQWAADFSQKVTWIATQRSQSAELHLNPAQLGPLEVSLKLNGDQATLQFTSAHAAVRDAIEQSIPRLRDMLADSGISLGNTTVSDQAPREQQQRGQAGAMRGDGKTDNTPDSSQPQSQTTTRLSRHDGMVDTFV